MAKEIIGSIYTDVSEDFQKGISQIARCVKAEKHDLAVVEMKGIKQIGNLYGYRLGSGFGGSVYDTDGLSPTITTMEGGNRQPMVVDANGKNYERTIVAMRGRNPDNPSDRTTGNPTEQRSEPNSQGICNTLTSVQKDNMVLEKAILTPRRTEYGKAIRKAYENGKVKESRHNMTELEPRTDGISNTLTTVQKDNLVIIKQATKKGNIECEIGGVADLSFPNSNTRRGRVQGKGNISPTITAQETGICRIEGQYRIRKLTPLECWRLMGFSDRDFHKAETVNSNSQLYKQAGNSIAKDVLMGIFEKMIQQEPLRKTKKEREAAE